MRRRETARHDVLRHRPFDTDIIATPIGRPSVAARIGGTETRAGPKTAGASHDSTQQAS